MNYLGADISREELWSYPEDVQKKVVQYRASIFQKAQSDPRYIEAAKAHAREASKPFATRNNRLMRESLAIMENVKKEYLDKVDISKYAKDISEGRTEVTKESLIKTAAAPVLSIAVLAIGAWALTR